MDLISSTADSTGLDPLIFKRTEKLFDLLPVHTQSAMASRAAMTVYGIAARIVQKNFLGYIKSWLDEAFKYRLRQHYILAPSLYSGGNEQKLQFDTKYARFKLSAAEGFLNMRTALHNKYGNRRLRVDDLNSSLTFIKKIAAISTATENKDLNDNFIRQWLLKGDIPRFTLEYHYEPRNRFVKAKLKQIDGSAYEGEVVFHIHQNNGKRDIVTRSISADVVSSEWKIQVPSSRQGAGEKLKRVIVGGIRGNLKCLEFDPHMQLIHIMGEIKASEGDRRNTHISYPSSAFYTETLLNLSKSFNIAAKIESINRLKDMPLKEKVCTTTKDIQPCVSLVQALNPIRPYDMAVRCHAVEAIAQWQNRHAPLSYMDEDNVSDTNGNGSLLSYGNSTVSSSYGEKSWNPYGRVQMNAGPDPCGGWTPQKLWSRHSPYEPIASSSSSNKPKTSKPGKTGNEAAKDVTIETEKAADIATISEKKADPWYGLHALMTILQAYFYNDIGDTVVPSYMHPPKFYSFRLKLVESISSIRDQNGIPPFTVRKIIRDLLRSALDSKDSRANSLYVAALLRALGRTSFTEKEVKETMAMYNNFVHFQAVFPVPRSAILVSCLRGIADMECSLSKNDKKFEFHSYLTKRYSAHVRVAAAEGILRVYLAGGQGDGLRTIEWLLARMDINDANFETSGFVRAAILEMLLRVIDRGMADELLKPQFLQAGNNPVVNPENATEEQLVNRIEPNNSSDGEPSIRSLVKKLWDTLNASSWYDWNLRKGLFQLYKAFFSYDIPEAFETEVDKSEKITVAAYPLVAPSSKNEERRLNKRKCNCLVDRIKPHNKQFGLEFSTPMLSPRRTSFGGTDTDLMNDPFTLDGGGGTSDNGKIDSGENNTSRQLSVNGSASPAMSPIGGISLGNDTTTSHVENKKERRKSLLISLKRKRNK